MTDYMPGKSRVAPDCIDYTNSLTFETLRRANLMRLPMFKNAKGGIAHSIPNGSDWSPLEWVGAVVGELGELSNILKKVKRGDVSAEEVQQAVANELADVQTYLDILAFQCGVDLSEATMAKFNAVSERVGCPINIRNGHEWGVLKGYCTNCGGKHARPDCPKFKSQPSHWSAPY